jgi:tetratricopeptide (TPR) repeat protein
MWLLRYGDVREAEEWIRIAVNVDPASLTTAELKARLAAAKNNPTEARSALLQRAEAPGAPVGVIARICEDIGLHDDAERLLKRVIEEKRSKQPEVALSLAAFYGRRGRTVEGIQLCEAERGRLPVLVVGEAAVQVLYHSSSPSERETARVASWLTSDAARAAGQERAVLQQLLASVRNLQGDYAAAAELYKQAISANPRDALALNNLAFLHSAREKRHDPALTLIDQARKLIGPNPNLLDTEALIRLNKGQADVALSIMSVVVAEAPSGAAYFHLAQIHLALKDETEARRAWRQAGEHGLKEADLHPLERTEYRRLALRFQ